MKVKIVDKREIPTAEPARVGKLDVLITYQLEGFKTYLIRIPQEEFNEEELVKRIKVEMEERALWTGKELEI
jgi:hypothetical protein